MFGIIERARARKRDRERETEMRTHIRDASSQVCSASVVSMLALMPLLAWLYARRSRDRLCHGRQTLPASHLYSEQLRNKLAEVGPLDACASPAEWCTAMQATHNRISGIVLLEFDSTPRIASTWDHCQESVREYWQFTRFTDTCGLAFVKIVDVINFQEPCSVVARSQQAAPRGLFFDMTNVCFDRLLARARASEVAGGGADLAQRVRAMCQGHGIDPSSLMRDSRFTVGLAMPVPHAHLVMSRAWSKWGFPL